MAKSGVQMAPEQIDLLLDGVLPDGLRVVSLTDEFGSERSLGDVVGCLREVAATLV